MPGANITNVKTEECPIQFSIGNYDWCVGKKDDEENQLLEASRTLLDVAPLLVQPNIDAEYACSVIGGLLIGFAEYPERYLDL
jgi:hypothetical protein